MDILLPHRAHCVQWRTCPNTLWPIVASAIASCHPGVLCCHLVVVSLTIYHILDNVFCHCAVVVASIFPKEELHPPSLGEESTTLVQNAVTEIRIAIKYKHMLNTS